MAPRMLALVPALALVACAADEPVTTGPGPIVTEPDARPPDPNKACELQLGTGVRQFEPLRDGDTVALYKGPQGGYMIYLSIRARGFVRDRVSFCYKEKFAETGLPFGDKCWLVQLPNDLGDGWFERVGIWGEVSADFWSKPGRIRGQDAILEAVLTDDDGCRAEDGYRVHVSIDPGR
jgi:hypothetical protein